MLIYFSILHNKGPSTRGEEFTDEQSTNTRRIFDEKIFFDGEEFFFVKYLPAKNFWLVLKDFLKFNLI